MEVILDFLHKLLDANWIMAHGGLLLVAFIVFAETGLFIGFFLPGDSLLFVAGLIIANATQAYPIAPGFVDLSFWMFIIAIAGILGNFLGYWFGQKSGPLLFERRDTWIFKKKHLAQAKDFYDKKGGGAIIFARFLPIVRTFAPIVAGIVKMDRRKFAIYNIIGSFCWVFSMMLIGYLLGNNPWVKGNLEYIVIVLVLVTTAPVLFKMFFSKKKPAVIESEIPEA